MVTMKKQALVVTLVSLVLLSMTAMASTGRYDQQIQQTASHKLHDAKHLQSVNSSVEDGIVILTGTVGIYQDKLDAAKKVKKLANVTGVRNDQGSDHRSAAPRSSLIAERDRFAWR